MSPRLRDQKLRRYVRPEAMLKHGFSAQAKKSACRPEGELFARRLIEHVQRAHCEKWRMYAQTRERRADGPTRMDVA
jgi:hypothetical protein